MGVIEESSSWLKPCNRVLAVETASRAGGVSLYENGKELINATGAAEMSHSVTLIDLIDNVLGKGGISTGDLNALVCATGPGSFTGLRIGISTVKGLADALSIKCVGVPTLHAVAFQGGVSDCTLALLPAGRGEFFAQLLMVASTGQVIELSRAIHVAPQHLFQQLIGLDQLLIAGLDVGGKLRSELDEAVMERPGWQLAPDKGNVSSSVGALGCMAIEAGELLTAEELGAIYVRPSDPELKLGTERLDRF